MKKLVAWLSTALLHPEKMFPPGFTRDLIPVLVVLRELSPHLAALDLEGLSEDQRTTGLTDAFYDYLKGAVHALGADTCFDFVIKSITDEKAALFLDGLDEVPFQDRDLIRETVRALSKRYHPKRMMITCRERSYSGAPLFSDFPTYLLAPFDQTKIKAFVSAWYQVQMDLGRMDADRKEQKSEDLMAAALSEKLRELSENPMLLTTMAIIHQREIGLPKERVRLYSLAVDVLLRRWQRSKMGDRALSSQELFEVMDDDMLVRSMIERVAYEAHRIARDKKKIRDTYPDGGKKYLDRLKINLVMLLDSSLTSKERCDAGVNLAVFGDTRKKITTFEKISFCYVPDGPFWMGSDNSDDLAEDNEKPIHLNETVDYPMWMTQFPITQAQYALFVDAGGYADRRYWPEAEEAGVWKEKGFKGRYDDVFREKSDSYETPYSYQSQ